MKSRGLTCRSSLTSMGLLSVMSGAQHAVVSVSSSDMVPGFHVFSLYRHLLQTKQTSEALSVGMR
jgi:hypothetical protein